MQHQHQPHQPPDELAQGFWRAWREQEGKSPRLAHLLLQRSRHLLERFQHFHRALELLSRPAQVRWQRKLGASLAGVALALALSGAPAAHAFPAGPAEAHINGTDCLLVDAITAANTDTATGDCAAGNPGLDTITLLSDVTLYSANNGVNGLPVIASAITIEGAGFTIARDNGAAENFRILQVAASGDLTLNQTAISGGGAVFNGGGIYNGGMLALNNSTVSGNSGARGAGISNGGTLTINNSTVSGNSSFDVGGGIANYGNVTISDSTISGNTATHDGGGIRNSSGSLTLQRSLISGNQAGLGAEILAFGGCVSAADANAPTCLASASTINSADVNLFSHDGLTNAQAFYGFTPDGDDIVATSDGTAPTALSAILDTTLQVNAPGDTATHALVAGSPAVDANTSGPATDQRGVSRPQGSGFDIGAYELEQEASNEAPVVTANNASVTVDEGETATNSGTVDDADGDTVTLSASLGTVTNNNDGAWSWSFDTTDDLAGTVTIT
ncbi:MAG: hypothetical protein KJZ93_17750, partial [Caldilineaceae bacterium]|nr:hypothetical protein [Caldilineaceae bacterium]